MNTFSRFSSTSNTASRSNDTSADSKALEVDLHDGLDRLEDFTLMMAFQSHAVAFEILTNSPSTHTPQRQTAPSPSTDASTSVRDRVVNIQAASLKKTA